MKLLSAILSSLLLAAAASGVSAPARADDTIKIGEINSYSGLPSFTEPYRKGWQLALDEINAAGGVDGKKLEVISKDDGGKPADAVTQANELVANDGVVMLAGTFFSNIGLAVSDYAKQKKILFLAAEPLTDAITMSKGNRYTFRLRPGELRAGRDARRRGREAAREEMGDDRAELRIRPVRRRRLQETPVGEAARHPVGRRAMAAARQDRRRRRGRSHSQDRAGSDLQRLLRPRSRQARARGQYARPVQGPLGRQPPRRRA